jgi:hypothetical protein
MSSNVIYKAKCLWGEHIWSYLHSITLIDNEFDNLDLVNIKSYKVLDIIKNLHLILPCELCAKHYIEWYNNLDNTKIYKPLELFYNTIDLHNSINKILNKSEITYDEALNKWSEIINNIENV